jgi:hypothetical protein
LKPLGTLDHVAFLSVDKEDQPDAARATVEGVIYFKGDRRKHFRAEEQRESGKWLIFEFAYSN